MPKVAEASATVVAPWAPSPSATAEGRRRAEAAFQRDRAGHDPEQRVEAEHPALPTPIRFCSIASAQQADR